MEVLYLIFRKVRYLGIEEIGAAGARWHVSYELEDNDTDHVEGDDLEALLDQVWKEVNV